MAEHRAKRHPGIKPLHPGEVLREDVIPALRKTKADIARLLGISQPAGSICWIWRITLR